MTKKQAHSLRKGDRVIAKHTNRIYEVDMVEGIEENKSPILHLVWARGNKAFGPIVFKNDQIQNYDIVGGGEEDVSTV